MKESPKDPPRKVPRLKVKVKSRSNDFILPNGLILKAGVETETIIYEDELAAVQAMVETQLDDITRAERKARDTIEKLVDSAPPGTNKNQARSEFSKSISKEASFELIVGRSILPLISCEVVERGLPPPEQEAEYNALAASQKVNAAQNTEMARIIAAEVAKAMANNKGGNNSR